MELMIELKLKLIFPMLEKKIQKQASPVVNVNIPEIN